MRWVWRGLLGLIVVVVAVFGMQIIASESGEVVVVRTTDAQGASHETRLWVVDTEAGQWLRSGGGDAGWAKRMLEHPQIVMSRDGVASTYIAEPDESAARMVNQLMREKYGWADQFIALMIERDVSLPFRLVPEES